MKKSLIAFAAMAAMADIGVVSTRRSVEEPHGHELRALDGGGLFTNNQTAAAKGTIPGPAAMGREAIPLRAEVTLASFATTDVYEMFIIPAGFKVVDWVVDCDDIDTGTPAVAFKVGVLNAGKTDLDTGNAIWKTGLTTGQAGGIARMDTVTALRAGSSTSDRVVGIIATTAAATFAAGVIGLTAWIVAD